MTGEPMSAETLASVRERLMRNEAGRLLLAEFDQLTAALRRAEAERDEASKAERERWTTALAAQCRLTCSGCASGFPVEYDAEDGRWWHQLPHGEGDVECMADPLQEVERALAPRPAPTADPEANDV